MKLPSHFKPILLAGLSALISGCSLNHLVLDDSYIPTADTCAEPNWSSTSHESFGSLQRTSNSETMSEFEVDPFLLSVDEFCAYMERREIELAATASTPE